MSAEIVKALVATGKWSHETAELGVAAGFKCEYCGKDFLDSPDTYKLWQVDHIIPRRADGEDKAENKAIACRQCNMDFKSRWNPLNAFPKGLNPTREELIEAVRRYVKGRREVTKSEIEIAKNIIDGG